MNENVQRRKNTRSTVDDFICRNICQHKHFGFLTFIRACKLIMIIFEFYSMIFKSYFY